MEFNNLPKFDQTNGELLCPQCGNEYLHHEKIEAFQRLEDAVSGLHVSIEGEELVVDKNLGGNPSMRRHGLKIQFRCESCSHKPVMKIDQHKGNTYITFE